MRKEDIVIGIPAFNESSVIEALLIQLKGFDFGDIVVVNDGSTDDTANKSRKAGVRVLDLIFNTGAGSAAQALIRLGRIENWSHLLLIDADGQHLPTDIEKLMSRMEKSQADLVIGNRFSHEIHNDIPRLKRMFNSLANILTNWFCKGSYADSQSGFRLLNRRAINKIDLESSGFGFCSEMIFVAEKSKLKVVEAGIHVLYTEYSKSKGQTNIWNGIKTAWQFIENV